ncbi:alpha/beta hydrolase [Kocuria sp.]|uniref:alpha/beta hydrolase n=1 Tax=Kocuria sp. TaxID=1871328 RepID=UPI0026E07B6F|nr:alpha/beta hydrolase [Kocuria sp.]MDO5617707.1 alpha/beta hydrolase [Kocuria sp.]
MEWTEDVLGPDFSVHQVAVSGRGVHTTISLVRYNPGPSAPVRGSVLYVHGWSDYFANPELARHVAAAGYHFYALDFHGYGRNLTDSILATGQIPGMADDLNEYAEDFQAARTAMEQDGAPSDPDHLVVIAHSTGGLAMSLLLMEQPGQVAGLALATPWIAPQGFAWLDNVIRAVAHVMPKAWQDRRIPVPVNTNYHRTLSADREGSWQVDPRWRPKNSFPITMNLLASTARARLRLLELGRTGQGVGAPVLLQISSRSLLVPWWDDRMHAADTVLDVRAIRRRIGLLSRTPTVISYPGAIHDVHRSAPSIRGRAFADLQAWLSELPLA